MLWANLCEENESQSISEDCQCDPISKINECVAGRFCYKGVCQDSAKEQTPIRNFTIYSEFFKVRNFYVHPMLRRVL